VRALLLGLAACGGSGEDRGRDADGDTDADADADTDADTDTDTDTDGILWSDVAPILAEACAPCHVDAIRPSGGLSVDRAEDLVGVIDPETALAYVEPGDVERSYLWLKLTDRQDEVPGGGGAAMPSTPLPADALAQIRRWIEEGARTEPGGTTPTDPFCEPVALPCTTGCPAGPRSVDHPAWHARLTTSPELSWPPVPGAVRYEVAVGFEPGADDVACWTDAGAETTHTFAALWGVVDGDRVVPSVRAFHADGSVSAAVSSAGWTVDIQPPEPPADVNDDRAPVDGRVSWSHPLTDVGAGFHGFEVALGTAPYSDDSVPWTPVGTELEEVLGGVVPVDGLAPAAWAWVSVRAVDAAGNASQPGTSPGFVTCPDHYAFVPGDDTLGTTPFCVARYEMRVQGLADGDVGFSASYVAESRPDGTPWSGVDKSEARVACDALGFSYQLISNAQWQTVARSIERNPANWSGGAVGVGVIPQGHCDEDPREPLSSDGGPCGGTNDPQCEDPTSADWWQRRTHELDNGDVVWDLAGNLSEQVDGSPGAPSGLWLSFDDAPFTSDPGWEDARLDFAPEGPYTEAQGTGRLYGGTGNLTRGGSYDPQYATDPGVFGGHHNTWWVGSTEGFRCVYVPM
jgi:hypothetical protein